MTRPQIKAIETQYAGCRFRSRLEARWAVFFDALDIAWEYEPEGFELPSGRYLPDFRLHGRLVWGPLWFEVKPFRDTGKDPRWNDLVRATGVDLAVSYGMHRPGDICNDQHGSRSILIGDVIRTVTRPGGIFLHSHPRHDAAYAKASAARFEFGESGATAVSPATARVSRLEKDQSSWARTGGPTAACPHGAWGVGPESSACDCVWCTRCRDWSRDNGATQNGRHYLNCACYADGSGSVT
jgi:hypothetical protein